jgi:GH25 family lysozyme M1 (1,4-beta-N-acetylmuramidase)
MVRIGLRGTSSGAIHADAYYEENIRGAMEAGIQTGVYFFAQAITVEEAIEESKFVLELLEGLEIDGPVAYDWEMHDASYRVYGTTPEMATACAIAFCQRIEDAGRSAMIYFNPNAHNKQFYIEELTGYGFWLAMYSDYMTYPYHIDMWQYTDQGVIPGIEGPVDINLYFPPEEE